MSKMKNFTAGLIRENPVFSLYLGLCSVLAVTTSVNNALGMGVTVIIVLVLSNAVISLLRKIIPDEIRIPVFIVIIATLVKCADLLLQAFTPELSSTLGVFISLIVVNCIILGRAEAFASKNGVIDSILDGLGMGIGYTVGLTLMALIREFLSTGAITLINPFTNELIAKIGLPADIAAEYAISLFKDPMGAFLTFALIAAGVAALNNRSKKGKESK